MTATFLVMTYSPQLSGKARKYGGKYLGVRVVETTDGNRPVSCRAKNVVRVVREWGGLYNGGPRSAGAIALAEAQRLADTLNTN